MREGLTRDDPPAQPASRVTGFVKRKRDGGWGKVRTSKMHPQPERAADPEIREDRIAGCSGKVRQVTAVQLKDGTWRRIGDVVG